MVFNSRLHPLSLHMSQRMANCAINPRLIQRTAEK